MVIPADRRRVNGPSGSTSDPRQHAIKGANLGSCHARMRQPGELRDTYVKTGLIPSAAGSAYLEIGSSSSANRTSNSGFKVVCTVHGPRPLPRSAPFSPHLLISTRVKFALFAGRDRRSYVPDSVERDLASQLQNTLKTVLLTERWPKSGLDVLVTVIDAEEASEPAQSTIREEWSLTNTLAACVNVATAAIADACMDCIDLLTVGTAAYIRQSDGQASLVLDPSIADSEPIVSLCAVGFLQSRDEVIFLWTKDDGNSRSEGLQGRPDFGKLVGNAIEAAKAVHLVVTDALKISAELSMPGLAKTTARGPV